LKRGPSSIKANLLLARLVEPLSGLVLEDDDFSARGMLCVRYSRPGKLFTGRETLIVGFRGVFRDLVFLSGRDTIVAAPRETPKNA